MRTPDEVVASDAMDSTEDTDPMAPRLETTELAAAAAPSSCRRCACAFNSSVSGVCLNVRYLRWVHAPVNSVQLLAVAGDRSHQTSVCTLSPT